MFNHLLYICHLVLLLYAHNINKDPHLIEHILPFHNLCSCLLAHAFVPHSCILFAGGKSILGALASLSSLAYYFIILFMSIYIYQKSPSFASFLSTYLLMHPFYINLSLWITFLIAMLYLMKYICYKTTIVWIDEFINIFLFLLLKIYKFVDYSNKEA